MLNIVPKHPHFALTPIPDQKIRPIIANDTLSGAAKATQHRIIISRVNSIVKLFVIVAYGAIKPHMPMAD